MRKANHSHGASYYCKVFHTLCLAGVGKFTFRSILSDASVFNVLLKTAQIVSLFKCRSSRRFGLRFRGTLEGGWNPPEAPVAPGLGDGTQPRAVPCPRGLRSSASTDSGLRERNGDLVLSPLIVRRPWPASVQLLGIFPDVPISENARFCYISGACVREVRLSTRDCAGG